MLEGLEHQGYALEELVDELGLERDASRGVLFDTMFNYQEPSVEGQELRAGELKVEGLAMPWATAKFDLTMSVVEKEERGVCVLKYASDLYTEETAERLLRRYAHLAEQVMKEPGVKVGELELLESRERDQLLSWGRGAKQEFGDEQVHELFEARVDEEPGREALVYGQERLSYGELDERANRLAHTLREEHGVGPDKLVGLCLERSVELVVGILGVLKAGGAYVPLDPEYPAARLNYMLAETGVEVVLTKGGLPAGVE